MPEYALDVDRLSKVYSSQGGDLVVLDQVSFKIEQASCCAVVGPSGSGKTTLLGLCAGLDRPSSGRILLNGADLGGLSEEKLAAFRNRFVGFVFQTFQLIPTLTALENVMVPGELRRERNVRERSVELLGRVGLQDRMDHYPTQLSGGEQQRVALARAFVNRPQILFADEPTGNLDVETAKTVEELLFQLNHDSGTTLIVVTHNGELAAKADRILSLKGGRVVGDHSLAKEEART